MPKKRKKKEEGEEKSKIINILKDPTQFDWLKVGFGMVARLQSRIVYTHTLYVCQAKKKRT